GFQNYYKDVSLRMKNRELDMLIVVNMFLTGFDAPTLNTLWVDKNLRAHGLIQAFSRTNRILNSVKTFGNIVCFRNLQKRVDAAIALFGDGEAGGAIVLKSFDDYYYTGGTDAKGKPTPSYVEIVDRLQTDFPIEQRGEIKSEESKKGFISLFGAFLRMRNLLLAFDEFVGKEILTERDFQDYLSLYQDYREEWKDKREKGEAKDITDDVVFEIELIKQIVINIDYILALVAEYRAKNCQDKEILVKIRSAVSASHELRSKKELIEKFLDLVNDGAIGQDVDAGWSDYVEEEREKKLAEIISAENLKEEPTRKFISRSFREGKIQTAGMGVDELLPPVRLFGLGGGRVEKKNRVCAKLQAFFETFFGIGRSRDED
ncbi:MAG: type I restriction endonuclease subunit R, partial [Thermoguttaceae bacterium]|nr:type I restriction endonuclease subunit R [Thermoguttaceae bacterium]